MNGTSGPGDVIASASEQVLKRINELYAAGLSAGAPGAIGLKGIADALGLAKQIRKPRKKISVMIVGNHSAGKSSFINWYIGERVCKTGVAIETRGFILCTSGRKRETLTGDATIRYFDYLEDLGGFEGLLPNLFTEITTSKERSFACVDFVDTPGLVDGDMKYPFAVKDSIMWMADHVDLILVFFDPVSATSSSSSSSSCTAAAAPAAAAAEIQLVSQATCKRTMEVVEQLNNTHHLEKIHYFMSKADEVLDERDRQRVLIQITQNLATRIRNSHAFNLPTFYLPHEDDGGLPCSIPNAIEDVCTEIDKAINQTVQKTLRQLKADCATIQATVAQRRQQDAANREANAGSTARGAMLAAGSLLALLLLVATLGMRTAGVLCTPGHGGSSSSSSSSICSSGLLQPLQSWGARLDDSLPFIGGVLLCAMLALGGAAKVVWRHAPVLDRRQQKRLDEYSAVVARVAQQAELLYEQYFLTLANAEER
ncbi:sarcaleumin-like protein [Scenedesmus sp. NREL 46B-D3]|nr:sarcaleumin-like protein [Scenedesmus sp. NREL 46B-D3]